MAQQDKRPAAIHQHGARVLPARALPRQVARPGSEVAGRLPSRIGEKLVHPQGGEEK